MNSNERLKEIRENLEINQTVFGDKINLSRSQIAAIENNLRTLTDRVITDICREFNVNEEWLRTGEGKMFREMSLVDEINKEFELTEIQKIFVRQLIALPPEKKKVIDELITNMYNEMKKEGL